MEFYKKQGSEEKLIEMMEKVNKINLNEKKEKTKVNESEYDEWGHKKKKSRLDEVFDSPKEKDENYLDKTTDPEGQQPNKADGGVEYPAVVDLRIKDKSLDKVAEEDNEVESNLNITPEEDLESNIETAPESEEEIVGGLADGAEPQQFDPQQILKGIEVEMEHTNNPRIALELVMDHLIENPEYYGSEGENPEIEAQISAEQDAEELSDDSEKELEDELLGYQSKNVDILNNFVEK